MSLVSDPAFQEPTTRLVLLVASIAGVAANRISSFQLTKTTFDVDRA